MKDSQVAILLEDLRSQFRVFGEGLRALNEKVDKGFLEVNDRIDRFEHQNHQEHRLMLQMIKELNEEQSKLKKAK